MSKKDDFNSRWISIKRRKPKRSPIGEHYYVLVCNNKTKRSAVISTNLLHAILNLKKSDVLYEYTHWMKLYYPE